MADRRGFRQRPHGQQVANVRPTLPVIAEWAGLAVGCPDRQWLVGCLHSLSGPPDLGCVYMAFNSVASGFFFLSYGAIAPSLRRAIRNGIHLETMLDRWRHHILHLLLYRIQPTMRRLRTLARCRKSKILLRHLASLNIPLAPPIPRNSL